MPKALVTFPHEEHRGIMDVQRRNAMRDADDFPRASAAKAMEADELGEELVAIAESIARKAHAGQTDKSGRPYIDHPAYVAAGVRGVERKCVAWLHDTVEDTDVTLDDLRAADLPETVVAGVEAMTHRADEKYLDYVRRVALNPIARSVKLADLAHNMDLSRLPDIRPRDLERLRKYRKAREILEDAEIADLLSRQQASQHAREEA